MVFDKKGNDTAQGSPVTMVNHSRERTFSEERNGT
jgi:hypothetical protein